MKKFILNLSIFAVITVALAGLLAGISCDINGDTERGAGDDEEFELIDAIGPELVDAEGDVTSSEVLAEKEYVLLYFSAEWCPPCREYTPKVVDFYDEYAEEGNFELVFMSADRSEDDMYDYMREYEMNWLAVPYDRREETGLSEEYGVRGIPKLVALDQDGNVVKDSDRDGRIAMLEELAEMF